MAIWPAVRVLESNAVEVVDICSGRSPVGLSPPFVLCEESDVQPTTACGCACGV